MDMKKLLGIVSGEPKQLNESISECGEMPAQPAMPTSTPVSMSLSMNAQGIDQIKELIQLIQTTEPAGLSTPDATTAMEPSNGIIIGKDDAEPGTGSDEIDTIKNLAGIQIEPDAIDTNPEKEGAYDANTTPNPEIKDINFMTKDMAGGLNKEKTMSKHSYKQGDNPLAMETIESLKNKLLKEYEDYKLDETKLDEASPGDFDSEGDYQDALANSMKPKVNPKANNDEFTMKMPTGDLGKATKSKHKVTWQRDKEGLSPNGKQYNCTVIIDAVDKYSVDAEVNSLEDYHRGAKDVVDVQEIDNVDPLYPVRAVLYVVDNHKYGMWKPWKNKPAISKTLSF